MLCFINSALTEILFDTIKPLHFLSTNFSLGTKDLFNGLGTPIYEFVDSLLKKKNIFRSIKLQYHENFSLLSLSRLAKFPQLPQFNFFLRKINVDVLISFLHNQIILYFGTAFWFVTSACSEAISSIASSLESVSRISGSFAFLKLATAFVNFRQLRHQNFNFLSKELRYSGKYRGATLISLQQ